MESVINFVFVYFFWFSFYKLFFWWWILFKLSNRMSNERMSINFVSFKSVNELCIKYYEKCATILSYYHIHMLNVGYLLKWSFGLLPYIWLVSYFRVQSKSFVTQFVSYINSINNTLHSRSTLDRSYCTYGFSYELIVSSNVKRFYFLIVENI